MSTNAPILTLPKFENTVSRCPAKTELSATPGITLPMKCPTPLANSFELVPSKTLMLLLMEGIEIIPINDPFLIPDFLAPLVKEFSLQLKEVSGR